MMELWIVGVILILLILWQMWKAHTHPAQILCRQAAKMNWVYCGTEKDIDGYKNNKLQRDSFEAVVSFSSETVQLTNPNHTTPFKDFIELERWLAKNNDLENPVQGTSLKSRQPAPEKEFVIERGSPLENALRGDDIYADTGVLMVEMHKKFAETDGAAQQTRDNWSIIKNWLELDDGAELGQAERQTIKRAYKAYLAIGVSPSVELAPVFEEASKYYKAEGYDFEPDKPPNEVLEAFVKMLSS
jgi:hypothetical protein